MRDQSTLRVHRFVNGYLLDNTALLLHFLLVEATLTQVTAMRILLFIITVFAFFMFPSLNQASDTIDGVVVSSSASSFTVVPKHEKPCSCKRSAHCSAAHCALPDKAQHDWFERGKRLHLSPYNTEQLSGRSLDIPIPPPKFSADV